MLWSILGIIAELGVLICFIIVVIKQFKTAGALHGIIGIVTCTIWTFIWGWMNSGKLNLRNIMLIWTVLIIVVCVLFFVGGISFNASFGTPTH